jgi:hypothetical protein
MLGKIIIPQSQHLTKSVTNRHAKTVNFAVDCSILKSVPKMTPMKRRELIKLGGLAFAGTAAPSLQSFKPKPTYHFIGVGSFGGRILEAFASYQGDCKYTWVKDQHTNTCEVGGVRRITHEQPYSSKYFSDNRINELPVEEIPLHFSALDLNQSDVHIILGQPSCYLSYCIIPQLIENLEERNLSYHSIISQPFSFFSEMWHTATRKTVASIGDYPGKLTIISIDSLKGRKEKINLQEAFEFMYQRFFEEFMAMRNRI